MASPPTHQIVAPESVDIESRDAFRRDAEALIDEMESGQVVVLDFSGTEFVDTAGLGTMALLHERAAKAGLTIQLLDPNEEVRASLELARLADLFHVD